MAKLIVSVYQINEVGETGSDQQTEQAETKPQEVSDLETQKLLKDMQKTLDEVQKARTEDVKAWHKELETFKQDREYIKTYLEDLKTSREQVTTDSVSDNQTLIAEVREMKKVSEQHYTWFVFGTLTLIGVLIMLWIYRMIRFTW